MTLIKKINYLKSVYKNLKKNPLTTNYAIVCFGKYVYINFLLYFFNREVSFIFLDTIKIKAKKGDGIVGNFHSILQEPNESLFLLHYLTEEDVFLDIGANVGHYTLIVASKTEAEVFAIEPVPKTFKSLQVNLSLNKLEDRVKVHNVGLSDKNGVLFFTDDLATTNRVNLNGKGIEVKVKSIDEYFKDEKLTVIKIDVEGYEWFVLKGAMTTLKKEITNIVIIELNNSAANFGIEESKIIDFLKDSGFKPYEYNIFERKLIPLLDKNHKQFNTIFIKDIDLVKQRISIGQKVSLKGCNF